MIAIFDDIILLNLMSKSFSCKTMFKFSNLKKVISQQTNEQPM